MTFQSIAFLLVAGAAFGYSGYRFSILVKLLKAQKGKAKPFKDIGDRVRTTIVNVLGQKAVLQKPGIGFAHAMIFWGFIVITAGTLEQFASTLIPGTTFEFIGETPYSLLLGVQEFFTAGVLFAVFYAAYRRYIKRPDGLTKPKHGYMKDDATRVLVFTASLMVSIISMNVFHILAEDPAYRGSMWVSNFFASLIGAAENPDTAHALSLTFKWIHMILVMGFAVFIPGSKHLHIVAAGPNTFLKQLTREKGMRPINFEDETNTQYGVAKVSDFSWKDILDTYACTECGRCQDLCPAYNTQKPLSPKALIISIKENLYANKEKILAGKSDEVSHIIDHNNTDEVISPITTILACEVACPVFIEHTDKIYDIRRNLVMMESRFPPEVQTVFKNLETNASPWAFPSSDRGVWAQDSAVKTMAESSTETLDALLWVGCAGSFDDRNKKVMKAFVSLLKKAGIKFAILGNEEQCTGDPARRIGNEYLFQTLAKANVETLNRYNVKKIITACPHCFNTLKNEYPEMGGKYEVFHHSQFLGQLIRDGKLKPNKAIDETITYHDSCYLGRWNNVYEQPRSIIQAIPSAKLVEMKSTGDKSMCCGAGGGRAFMEEHIGKHVNVARTEQALETNAGIVAAACPFCMIMMTDGVKTKEKADKVKVMDIAELMDQAT